MEVLEGDGGGVQACGLRRLGVIRRERELHAGVVEDVPCSNVRVKFLRNRVSSVSDASNERVKWRILTWMNESRSGGQAQGILMGTPWALGTPSQSLLGAIRAGKVITLHANLPSAGRVDTSLNTELWNEIDRNVPLHGHRRH